MRSVMYGGSYFVFSAQFFCIRRLLKMITWTIISSHPVNPVDPVYFSEKKDVSLRMKSSNEIPFNATTLLLEGFTIELVEAIRPG
jgi:hypothetical protein